jgi:hypothetical protein
MSFREGRIGLGTALLLVSFLLSLFFKERKIEILYIGLLFLLIHTSLTAWFQQSLKSLAASVILAAAFLALVRWDNGRTQQQK